MTTVGTASSVAGSTQTQTITVTQTVTATSGDFVQFLSAFPGMVIHSVTLAAAGTTSSTAAVGDTNVADRFITASDTGSTAHFRDVTATTVTSGVITGGQGYKYTVADTIGVTIGGANVSTKQYTLTVIFSRNYGNVASIIRG